MGGRDVAATGVGLRSTSISDATVATVATTSMVSMAKPLWGLGWHGAMGLLAQHIPGYPRTHIPVLLGNGEIPSMG